MGGEVQHELEEVEIWTDDDVTTWSLRLRVTKAAIRRAIARVGPRLRDVMAELGLRSVE